MSELMRFRLSRAPQRAVPDPLSIISLDRESPCQNPLDAARAVSPRSSLVVQLLENHFPRDVAAAFIEGGAFLKPHMGFPEPVNVVQHLDSWLTAQSNSPDPSELNKWLRGEAKDLVNQTPSWWIVRRAVSDSLIASLFADVSLETRSHLLRLMTIFGLVELMADSPDSLKTPDDVYRALRWRPVVFPAELLSLGGELRSVFVRQPAFADLYVVREEWNRYEVGEIAYIENVMASELKDRTHVRTDETEQTSTFDSERTELNERDSQSTDRFDMHAEATKDTDLAAHIDAKVDVSGQYGPAHIDAHVGASFDYSVKETDKRAMNLARESVTRAVTRVEEKVREVRTSRTLTRIKETNKHTIDNKINHDHHVTGIYRWVDKVQRFQIFKYPHRLLLEFEVPEPAAFKSWLREKGKDQGLRTQEPAPLIAIDKDGEPVPKAKALTPADINDDNYQQYVARYQVLGVEPPPPKTVSIYENLEFLGSATESSTLESVEDKTYVDMKNDSQSTMGLNVPAGYKATRWIGSVLGHRVKARDPFIDHSPLIPHTGQVWVVVGTTSASLSGDEKEVLRVEVDFEGVRAQKPGPTAPVTGRIPVAVRGTFTNNFELNIAVDCDRLPEKLDSWKFKTYEAIANAYFALKQQHEEEKAAREIQRGAEIDGDSPIQNSQTVREELKKNVIEMLIGSQFQGRPAMNIDKSGEQAPTVILKDALLVAPEIQFLEQAFEWENMSYVLYPYFWAGYQRWPELANIKSADPEFARFLRSGSARVVLPARPRFEQQALLYSALGIIWGGGPVPIPGSELYVSVAEEIKAQQVMPPDGVPGESWETRLPTTLTLLDKLGTALPLTNAGAKLDTPPGKTIPA